MADEASARAGSRRSSGPPRVVFIHIPKTAGTTLNTVLRANATYSARLGNVFKGVGGRVDEPDYDRMVAEMRANERARFFWGHTPFGLASFVPPEWGVKFITFLRDPVDRAISHYYHMVDAIESGGAQDGDEVEAALRSRLQKQGVIRGEFSLDVPYDVALSDGAFIADNLQTRMLSGLPRPFGPVTDDMLGRAIENIERFHCVGIAERFDESLVLLKQRIGYDSILYDDRRVNNSRPRGASVPDALRRAAENANTFDRELYRHALTQFESSVEFNDLDFRIDLAALRGIRGGVEAVPPDAPEELGSAGVWWRALLSERQALLTERRAHARTRGRIVELEAAEQNQAAELEKAQAALGALKARVARINDKLDTANRRNREVKSRSKAQPARRRVADVDAAGKGERASGHADSGQANASPPKGKKVREEGVTLDTTGAGKMKRARDPNQPRQQKVRVPDRPKGSKAPNPAPSTLPWEDSMPTRSASV